MRAGCAALIGLLCACTTPQPQPLPPPPLQPKPTPPVAAPSPPPSTVPPPAGAPSRPLPNLNLSGYPPVFKEGFRDGCDSFRGNYRRDNSRYGKDNDYTIGWQDGFSICRRQGK
jgi:hypothetical protein